MALKSKENKRKIRITGWPGWSWKKRLILFSSIFGGVWLFVEPLFALTGNTGLLTSIGVWGYLALLLIGIIPVVAQEFVERRRFIGRLSFISLDIILTKSGVRISVEAPKDIHVEEFLNLLLGTIASLAPRENRVYHLYKNNLLVKRGEHFDEVPIYTTLEEAGLSNGDVLKIRGYIRIEYQINYMSISYSQAMARVEMERARGKVFLDEDVAIGIATALEKGILGQDRADRLNKNTRDSLAASGHKVFIVDNSNPAN